MAQPSQILHAIEPVSFGSQGVLIDRIRMKVAIAFNRQWYAAESYNLPSAKAIYDKVTSPVGSLQRASYPCSRW
ncbi:MAG: hypothetical protein R2865_02630 [Deinococcales bacterium]